jgi:tRNA(adenine34) deaminase
VMWQSLSQPWRACLEEAWTAYCAGSVPIGACITDDADRVIARGRNCMFEPSAEGCGLSGCRMAHAEMNALLALGGCDHNVDPRQCTLYTTAEPCPMCIGAARMYLIGEVRLAARDPLAGSARFATATPFMERWSVEISGLQGSDLESVLLAIQAEFLLRRGTRWAELTERADPAFARAVYLGRKLFSSGELACLGGEGASVQEVLDWLDRELPESTWDGRFASQLKGADDEGV